MVSNVSYGKVSPIITKKKEVYNQCILPDLTLWILNMKLRKSWNENCVVSKKEWRE